MQRRSINRRRGLLLLHIETLDSAASTFNFNTFGIKEIIEQGAWDKHPGSDTDSDHAECILCVVLFVLLCDTLTVPCHRVTAFVYVIW